MEHLLIALLSPTCGLQLCAFAPTAAATVVIEGGGDPGSLLLQDNPICGWPACESVADFKTGWMLEPHGFSSLCLLPVECATGSINKCKWS